jgi:bacterioferritin-associated ferredoxin
MACTVHPDSDGSAFAGVHLSGRAMTRCECADVSFEEIARTIRREDVSLEEISRRTGCAGNCTACLPDLRRYLDSL